VNVTMVVVWVCFKKRCMNYISEAFRVHLMAQAPAILR
jgi:hypothetical protein